MSAGDLIHPEERTTTADQVAILLSDATRWYAAHLLLFVGMLLFIPGILAVTELAAERKAVAGHAARILILIATAAFSAIFVFEMLLGRFILDGADAAAAAGLLQTFQSVQVFGAIAPAALAFFVGIGLVLFALAQAPGPFRWPASTLALGAIFIFAEIASSQVVLSQIGNLLILFAGAGFAWHILRAKPAPSGA
jgi:hypothetical protein